MDMVNFIIQMIFQFPDLTKRVVFYELAWGFGFLFKMVEKIVTAQLGTGEKMIFSANKANLDQFIAHAELPEFIQNGPKKLDRTVHKEALPFIDMVKGKVFKDIIEQKNAIKINEYLQTLL